MKGGVSGSHRMSTEFAKQQSSLMLQQVADASTGSWDDASGGGGGGSSAVTAAPMESLLREASPVLEAFGNAKTIRNDNSSRFGKYVTVQYSADGGIVGASNETYLLERSRVVDIAEGERNYHIFYQLLTDDAVATQRSLPAANGARVPVERRRRRHVDGVNDAPEFAAVRRALDSFSIEVDEQQAVWRILAAVLSLGNIKFGAAAAQAGNDEEVAEVADAATLKAAARALGCTPTRCRSRCSTRTIVVMGNTIVKTFTIEGAAQARDALSKTSTPRSSTGSSGGSTTCRAGRRARTSSASSTSLASRSSRPTRSSSSASTTSTRCCRSSSTNPSSPPTDGSSRRRASRSTTARSSRRRRGSR